jgi:hypothetical protein
MLLQDWDHINCMALHGKNSASKLQTKLSLKMEKFL